MSACDTCALGKSGGAADEPRNRMVATICAMSGRPFFCHHDRDGNEFDWQAAGAKSDIPFLELPPNKRRICEGWKREVAVLAKRGVFTWDAAPEDVRSLRRYQQLLGKEALLRLDEYINEKDQNEKEKALVRLKDCLRALKMDVPTA